MDRLHVLNNKIKFSGILFILLIALFSVHGAVLQEGIDYDITFSDSSRGIWWSEMSIEANTGINVGDIIEIPYSASNSTDYGLYPLILKVKDEDTIICVNELLDNIDPFTTYPLCFYNNNPMYAEAGFNYSNRESLGFSEIKEYELVWGKFYQKEFPFYIDTITETDSSVLTGFTKNELYLDNKSSSVSFSYYWNKIISFSTTAETSVNHPITTGIKNISYLNADRKMWIESTDYGKYVYGIMNDPKIGNWNSPSHNYPGNWFYKNETFYNLTASNYNVNTYCSNTANCHESYFYGTYRFEDYWLNLNVTSYPYSFCNQLEVNNGFSFTCNEGKLNFNFDENSKVINFALSLPIIKINKESDDILTGINLIPYQTSLAYPTYLSIQTEGGSTLWSDLYEFDTPILTNNLDSYIQNGDNTIKILQTNSNGGIWTYFQGFYNTPPTLTTNPTISPTTISKGTTVTASEGTYNDIDSDPQSSSEFRWYKNGALSGYTSSSINLGSSTYVKGDTIKVEQRVYDGTDWSNWYSSAQYTLQNSPPAVTYPSLSDTSLSITDNVNCVLGSYSDADGDPQISSSITWYKNDILVPGQTGVTIDLDVAGYGSNDKVKCGHEVSDGTNTSGVQYSGDATIGNSAPTLTTNPSISPAPVYKNYTVTCNAGTYNDIDADPQTGSEFRWYENGGLTAYSTQTLNLSSTSFDRSDAIKCEQRVSDGTDWSGYYQSSELTIQNSQPTTTAPTLSNTNLHKTDTVTCNAGTYNDIDSDPISSSEFRWYKNGADTGITTSSINLNAQGYNKGDTVKCSYRVSDGSLWSTTVESTQATIQNTIPTLTTDPTLTPTSIYKNTTVTCNPGTYNDIDGDSLDTIQYDWYKNGISQGLNSASLNIQSSSFVKNDNVKCMQRVYDGQNWSIWHESNEYTILNTLPTIDVEVTPQLITTPQNINCRYTNYNDIDSDVVTSFTIEWYNGATQLYTVSNINSLILPSASLQTNINYTCKITINQGSTISTFTNWAMMTNLPPSKPTVTTLDTIHTGTLSESNFCVGTDPNNDPLTYTVEYSSDKSTWTPIISGSANSDISWDTTGLSGTQYIRCITNDGIADSEPSDTTYIEVVDYIQGVDFNLNRLNSNKGIWWSLVNISAINPLQFNKNLILPKTLFATSDNVVPLMLRNVDTEEILCVHEDIASIYSKPSCFFDTEMGDFRFNIPEIVNTNKVYEISAGAKGNSTISSIPISKESGDFITNAIISPFKTNNNWVSFMTLKDTFNIVVYYDLYDLDAILSTSSLKSYLESSNSTQTFTPSQSNADGGYYLSFAGNYNSPPTINPVPTITNTTPITKNAVITCNVGVYNDVDGDSKTDDETYWFRNGIQTSYSDLELNLSNSTFVKGDTIKCGERVNDGTTWSDWYYSTEYTVEDNAPTFIIDVTPHSPQPTDDLNCSFSNYNDIDGDAIVSYMITWKNSTNTLLTTNSETSLLLPNGMIDTAQVYECLVEIYQASGSYNQSRSSSLSNVAPTIDSVKIPTTAFSQTAYIENFCVGDDINYDPLTYTIEYSQDMSYWTTIATNQNTSNLLWNISSLADNTYYLRCRAFDGTLISENSSSVPIIISNFNTNHEIVNDAYYMTRYEVTSVNPTNSNQYSSGTNGLYLGDFNGNVVESYFYPPVKFDGTQKLYTFSLTPYQFYEAGNVYQTGVTQSVYDILIYEIDNIGDIPDTAPIYRINDQLFEMDEENTFNLNVIPTSDKYIAVKVCLNADAMGVCSKLDNGGDDLLFYYGGNTGTYITKIKNGASVTTYKDANVKFNWQDSVAKSLQLSFNKPFSDELLEPFVIMKNENIVCVNPKLSSYYPDKVCINSDGSGYNFIADELSKTSSNDFDILWGKELSVIPGVINDGLLKEINLLNDVRMEIYGLSNNGSYPTNLKLNINGNDVWTYPAILKDKETTIPLKQYFTSTLNNLLWTSTSKGKVIYYYLPYYLNFSVSTPIKLDPVSNGLAYFEINMTTNFDISPLSSYCEITGNDVISRSTTIVNTGVDKYTCRPSLNYYNVPGSYKWTVHVENSDGISRESDGYFTYGKLTSKTVTSLDFGDVKLENNSETLKERLLISNSGNTEYGSFTINVLEDKFWDDDGEESFEYEDRIGYADTKNNLDSARYLEKLDFDDPTTIFNGTLMPNQVAETWWKLDVDRTLPTGDFSTKWDLKEEED